MSRTSRPRKPGEKKNAPTPKRRDQEQARKIGGGQSLLDMISKMPRAPRGEGANGKQQRKNPVVIKGKADEKRGRKALNKMKNTPKREVKRMELLRDKRRTPSQVLAAARWRNKQAADSRRERLKKEKEMMEGTVEGVVENG